MQQVYIEIRIYKRKQKKKEPSNPRMVFSFFFFFLKRVNLETIKLFLLVLTLKGNPLATLIRQ